MRDRPGREDLDRVIEEIRERIDAMLQDLATIKALYAKAKALQAVLDVEGST